MSQRTADTKSNDPGPTATIGDGEVRQVAQGRGGLLAFDVGVGATSTALAIVARAHQDDWGRRPRIVVQPSVSTKR